MAGAFLPWEEWIAKLLHGPYVALRLKASQGPRRKDLFRSRNWPQVDGIIHQIEFDSSLPREGLRYAYQCEKGYYSGLYWRWFDCDKPRAVKVGDRILVLYNPDSPEDSVFLDFQEKNSAISSVFSAPEL